MEAADSVRQLVGLEAEFQQNRRQQLLAHVWDELKHFEAERENFYYAVLSHRAKNQNSSSMEMATQLSTNLGQTVTLKWVRQKTHRARQKFAEPLIAEVPQSMNATSEDEILEELSALGLKKYL